MIQFLLLPIKLQMVFEKGQKVVAKLPKGGYVSGEIKSIFASNGKDVYVIEYEKKKGPNKIRTVQLQFSDIRAITDERLK